MSKTCLISVAVIFLATAQLYAADPAADLLESSRQAMAHGDSENALKFADQAIAADAKNPLAYLLRGSIHDARREFDQGAADYSKVIELQPESTPAYQRRGEDHFRLGQFKESVADFDKVIALNPDRAPYHWQRGISLYYAGEFELGAKQFELHKTVNAEDVENAVWHFLCVARTSNVEKARDSLIPIHGDSRVPMMQIYALFGGKGTRENVMDAVKAGEPGEEELKERMFYAHLYLGLYEEAAGNTKAAAEHIHLAAEKYAEEGYMGDVARVHAVQMQKRDEAKK